MECFKVNDTDINKIKVSGKKLYSKQHNSYKYYVFYEHDGAKYIPLKIILKDVVGYYNDYKGNGKTMNFKLDDASLDKIYDIFEYIEKKKLILIILHMKVKVKKILKQKYLVKYVLEKTKTKKLI